MIFNVNNNVKVKLTETGKEILKKQFVKHAEYYPNLKISFDLPEEDENGYSEWQLHVLMNAFGEHMINGSPVPFETDIIIPEKKG